MDDEQFLSLLRRRRELLKEFEAIDRRIASAFESMPKPSKPKLRVGPKHKANEWARDALLSGQGYEHVYTEWCTLRRFDMENPSERTRARDIFRHTFPRSGYP